LQFLVKTDKEKVQLYFFPSVFVSKTLDPVPDSLEMPDPDSTNPDPQHWLAEMCSESIYIQEKTWTQIQVDLSC
jgi:hypothetical protein